MKYTINKLAKLLDVSTNTIRRYEDMGYFSSVRNEENGYRYYDDNAIINLTHVRLMRRYGFTHEEIRQMELSGFDGVMEKLDTRYKTLGEEIAYLQNLQHRLRDDRMLMSQILEMKDQIVERDCVELYYITYQENGKLLLDGERLKLMGRYLEVSPELSRGCLIRREGAGGGMTFKNIWAVKTSDAQKHHLPAGRLTSLWPKHWSIMGIIKICMPDNLDNLLANEQEFEEEYSKYEAYMREKGYEPAGDEILGLLITRLREGDITYLYLLLSIPVNKMSQ